MYDEKKNCMKCVYGPTLKEMVNNNMPRIVHQECIGCMPTDRAFKNYVRKGLKIYDPNN